MKKVIQTLAPKGSTFGFIVPEYVMERPISSSAKLLYSILCNYAGYKDHCWPRQKTLAKRLSCCVSSIKNYLKELREQELIYIEHTVHSSKIFILLPEELSQTQVSEQRVQKHQKPMNSNVSQISSSENLNTSTSTHIPKTSLQNEYDRESEPDYPQPKDGYPQPKDGYINNINKYNNKYTHTPKEPQTPQAPQKQVDVCVSDFEKVWEAYPKKQAKDQAKKEWQKLAHSGELPPTEVLLSAIRHFSNTTNWQKEEGRFIPFMGKWLRGQNWLAVQDAVNAELKEAEKKQAYEQEYKQRQEQIQQEKNAEKDKNESLRYEFKRFASCFADFKEGNPINSMLSGLWFYLEKTFKAPRPSDVPEDNNLTIKDFLMLFKQNQTKNLNLSPSSTNTQNLGALAF